ncbi:hypothetical protein HBB16_11855 [Pseudonocardia sp. MCCB 268]|nr:hypothetical protein [Pseudonocardia cytotoxica]
MPGLIASCGGSCAVRRDRGCRAPRPGDPAQPGRAERTRACGPCPLTRRARTRRDGLARRRDEAARPRRDDRRTARAGRRRVRVAGVTRR